MTDAAAGNQPLTAVRRRLPPGPPVDPYRLAGTEGIVFDTGSRVLVGIGRALTIDLRHGLDDPTDLQLARAVLAAIECDDRSGLDGAGVRAFAALPFDREAPTSLVVPDLTYGREDDGSEWVTVLGSWSGADPRNDLLARQGRHTSVPRSGSGRSPRVVPRTPDARFLAMVTTAVAAIQRGELAKVVLSRQVDLDLGAPIDLPELLARWRQLEPSCTVFSMPVTDGRFVGASPELLVERVGDRVRCRPLAGTAPQGSPSDDATFRGSRKDAGEHRLVVDAIGAALDPLCTSLEVPSEPDLVHLHSVVHLGTSIEGVLRPAPDGSVPSALELVGVLHPTPAVGGVPRSTALAAIAQLEPDPRGAFTGPVGWLDAAGDGSWVLGIRALTLRGDTARLAAGVGIVDGSVPEDELAETDLKLAAVLGAVVPDRHLATSSIRTVA